MTKGGRPSRIAYPQYFFGVSDDADPLVGQREGVIQGQRLAMYLNGEDFSLGSHRVLSLVLNPALPPGAVVLTDRHIEWWHCYAHVGVPPDFAERRNATELVMDATVAALKAARPDLADIVEHADRIVRANGKSLRFLMRAQPTKRYLIERSFSIDVLERVNRPQLQPTPNCIFTSLTDLATGAFLDGPAKPLPFEYPTAFMFNRPMRVAEIEATMASFVPRMRPPTSKLVTLRH